MTVKKISISHSNVMELPPVPEHQDDSDYGTEDDLIINVDDDNDYERTSARTNRTSPILSSPVRQSADIPYSTPVAALTPRAEKLRIPSPQAATPDGKENQDIPTAEQAARTFTDVPLDLSVKRRTPCSSPGDTSPLNNYHSPDYTGSSPYQLDRAQKCTKTGILSRRRTGRKHREMRLNIKGNDAAALSASSTEIPQEAPPVPGYQKMTVTTLPPDHPFFKLTQLGSTSHQPPSLSPRSSSPPEGATPRGIKRKRESSPEIVPEPHEPSLKDSVGPFIAPMPDTAWMYPVPLPGYHMFAQGPQMPLGGVSYNPWATQFGVPQVSYQGQILTRPMPYFSLAPPHWQ